MEGKLALLIKTLLLSVTIPFYSCIGQKIDYHQLVEKGDSLAQEYIQSFIDKGEHIDTIYMKIDHHKRFKKCTDIYTLEVFSSPRPIENQKMPFKYTILRKDDKFFVSYHYSKFHKFKSKEIRAELKEQNLLAPVDEEGAFFMEDLHGHLVISEESWHCFIDKRDISQVKVLPSFSALEIRERPVGCNLEDIN